MCPPIPRRRPPARKAAGLPRSVGLLLLAVAGCGYSFRSPVPEHLDTVYVPTFENETREFALTQQLTERVINEFLNESPLRLAGNEDDADLVVRGVITGYEEEALSYDPRLGGNPDVFARRVLISVDVELHDRVRDETLWENPSLTMWGEFNEEQGETRESGIERALVKIAEELLRHVAEEF